MVKRQTGQRTLMRTLFSLAVVLLILAGLAGVQSASAKSRAHTIPIKNFKFLPATLIVKVGDAVVWKNEDIAPHTATARGKNFDSGNIEPGASWKYVANKKGTYFYYCAFHPNMKGKLIVR